MYYYIFIAETPYCGTANEYYYAFEHKPTEAELTEIGEEICINNAESYEYFVTGWGESDFDEYSEEEQEEMICNYYADCSYEYREITKEEYEQNV